MSSLNVQNSTADIKETQSPQNSLSLACTNLVEDCEYGDLTDQMIRDRIVVGTRNRALSEKHEELCCLPQLHHKGHSKKSEKEN